MVAKIWLLGEKARFNEERRLYGGVRHVVVRCGAAAVQPAPPGGGRFIYRGSKAPHTTRWLPVQPAARHMVGKYGMNENAGRARKSARVYAWKVVIGARAKEGKPQVNASYHAQRMFAQKRNRYVSKWQSVV